MKKSKFTILLLFLVMILAISAVSAADTDDTSDSDLQAVDEAAIDEVASADVDDVVSTDSGADVVADPAVSTSKNFTTLQDDINTSPYPYLSLDSNYTKSSGENEITISKDFNIIGNGYTIDANNNGRIFNISQGVTLTLVNVILINGNDEFGGAIYNNGNLIITGCTLKDNNATYGGAVYSAPGSTINIKDGSSNFEKNNAVQGGAIYSEGLTNIINSKFIENVVATGGGAIVVDSTKFSIDGCNFTDNFATNTAGDLTCGGAVWIYNSNGTIVGSAFKGNKADTGDRANGGAIKVQWSSDVTMTGCTFEDNYAVAGGAISVQAWENMDNKVVIDDCDFINNTATEGGAVRVMQNLGVSDVTITNSRFNSNKATNGGAIAVKADTTLTIENTNFTDNVATGYGGAVYATGIYRWAPDGDPNGKYNLFAPTISVDGSKFTGNKGECGSAIAVIKSTLDDQSSAVNAANSVAYDNTTLTVTDSEFKANEITDSGAVFVESAKFDISGSNFTDNIGTGFTSGSALLLYKGASGTVSDSIFKGNKITGNPLSNGGAVKVQYGCDVEFTGCTFEENSAPKGGAISVQAWEIYPNNKVVIDDCDFIKNNATTNGGAILSYQNTGISELTIKNSRFNGNKALNGGAIAVLHNSTLNITGTNFTDNVATGYGGAVYATGIYRWLPDGDPNGMYVLCAPDVVVDGSKFTGNKAELGSAIAVIKSTLDDQSSAVNTANSVANDNTTLTLSNSEFSDNVGNITIYNSGIMALSKNTVDNVIFNNGTITTPTYIRVLDNTTVPVNYGENVTLNATVLDDNNNTIVCADNELTFAVEGDNNIIPGIFNDTTYIFKANYIPIGGIHVVSATYTGAGLIDNTLQTGVINISKANVTEFTVVIDPSKISYGENATIDITLLGVNGEKLNVTDMPVIVNDTPYLVNITNGTGSLNVSGLEAGDYAVVAIYGGDGNYNSRIASDVFTILKPASALKINVTIDDIDYLEEAKVNVTLVDEDGNPLNGIVKVYVDSIEYPVAVVDGEGIFYIRGIPAGLHDYNATFLTDGIYDTVQTANDQFEVSPKLVYIYVWNDDGVNVGEVGRIKVYIADLNENTIVDEVELIFTDADGNEIQRVNITTANNAWGPVDSVDLPFTATWAKGMYNVTVQSPNFAFAEFPEDEAEIYTFVSYGDASGTLIYSDGTAEVTGKENGFIEIKVLTNNVYDNFVNQTFYINDTAVADYTTLYQLYKKDDNNNIVPSGIYVKVSKKGPEIWLPVTVEYPVHKKYLELVVTDGEGDYRYRDNHEVVIELADNLDDGNYDLVSITCPATVVVFKYDEDSDSYLDVRTIDTKFENGVLSIDLSDLEVGEYRLKVNISDDNYQLHDWVPDEATGDEIEVDYIVLYKYGNLFYVNEVDVFINNVTGTQWTDYGDERIFNFTLWYGYYDDKVYKFVSYGDDQGAVEYGAGFVIRGDEDNGFIEVKVLSNDFDDSFIGKVFYINDTAVADGTTLYPLFDDTFTPIGVYVTVSDDHDFQTLFKYSTIANVTVYSIERDNNGDIISSSLVYNKDNVAIADGISESIDLSFLSAGEYKVTVALIDPYYQLSGWDEETQGDVDYAVEWFNVERADVNVIVNADQSAVYGENVTVTITVITPTGEKLNETVTVWGDYNDLVTLVNGTATFNISGLNAGSHTIYVDFNGTDNFKESKMNLEQFNVDKATPTFEINDTSAEWNIPVDIPIKLIGANGEPITGTVIVKVDWGVDGIEKVVRLDENGTGVATFTITTLGDLTITATFDGNDNYYGTTDTATLTVNDSTEAKMDVSAPSEIVYNETLNISVNLTNGRGAAIAGATVNYTVDGGEVQTATTADDGTVIIPIKDLARGEHTIVVLFDNASYVTQPSETITVDVKAAPSSVVIDDIASATYPGDVTITYAVINETDVTIVVKDADGNEITSGVDTSVDGTVTISGLNAGEYSITITNADKGNYSGSSDSKTFKVLKNASITTIEFTITGDKLVGSPLNITFTLPTDINASNVKAFIDGHPYSELTVNETTGVYTAVYDGFAVATGYTFRVEVDDPNYELISDEISFVIDKVTPEITISDIAGNVGDNVTATVTIAGGDATGYVLLNNVSYKVEKGQATISVPISKAGMQNITVIYTGNDKYYNGTGNKEFNAGKGVPTIAVEAIVTENAYPGAVTVIVTSDVDGIYNVTVGAETKEVTVADGVGRESFTGLAAGVNKANVTFTGDVNYNVTSVVKEFTAIEKAAPEFALTPIIINDTYKGKVNITIAGVDGTYSISIYNTTDVNSLPIIKDEIIVSGGKGSKVFENLTAGDKLVFASIAESANYTGDVRNAKFTIKKATIEIEPKAVGEFIVDGKLNVTFKLPTDIDGTVTIYVDGVVDPQTPTPVEGVYTIEFNAFQAGSHTFVATLTGDSNYADAMGQTTFDVEKVNVTISIVPDNSVPNPENILIKVAENATGTILVEIPGYLTLQQYEIDNGAYTLQLGPIPAGEYEIFVTYMGDAKYNNASASATFTIVKLTAPDVIVNITDTEIVGQKDIIANITVGDNFAYPGNVTVFVDGAEYQTVAIDEYGNVIVNISALENGTHTIGVKYNGNAYFNASDVNITIVTVTKAPSSVTIDPISNVTYGKTIVIKYTIVNETDSVTISITDEAGNTYDRTVEDGVIIIDKVIPAGKYVVSIHNGENGFYTESQANATFYVTDAPEIDIKVAENTTSPTFTISLPDDATGYLLVDIDGNNYYAPVVNGTATVTVPALIAGNYTANITYTGDDKYPSISNTTTVSLPSNLPNDAISIPASSSTYNPTYGVNLPKDATGTIEVDIDGKKYYAAVENGKASVSVPGLSTGAHNVTVTYSGDDKYTKISKSATVILTEPVVILVGTNVKVIYSANGEYKVVATIDGAPAAGKTVTINYNGKNYNVVTDSKGYATLKLNTKVKPKKYTVTTTFMGAKTTNKVTVKHVVKAKNAKVKQSKKVNKVKVALKKVDGKYLAGKKITIKFKGKKYKVKTNNKGKAKWKVKRSVLAKLKVGKKYKYTATYGKDKVTKKLKIKK